MSVKIDKKIKDNLRNLGFTVIRNFFSKEDLDNFERCVVSLYSQQAKKIKDYRTLVAALEKSKKSNFEKYSVAIVARIWDPSDDLTLSGDMAAQPYGKNIGRSDLIVNPDVDENL